MSKRRIAEFVAQDKIRMLLWCARHCCLCGKPCGVDIEIAHIDEKGPAAIDNAIPLCYECHARIGHYNREHPRGNKYKPDELKARREQVYEHHTRHLVPPITFEITQDDGMRKLPAVGFHILHHGNSLPVRALVRAEINLSGRTLGTPPSSRLYDGSTPWHLNPRHGFNGWFAVHDEVAQSDGTLEIVMSVTVIDEYERRHQLLPVSWVHMRAENAWFAHPAPGQM